MDKVVVTCYGTPKIYDRQQAIKEFTTAVLACEGSERDRYCRILSGLRSGKTEVTDEEPQDLYEALFG